MRTDWQDGELASEFEAFEGTTERTVGFPTLFRKLRLGNPDVRALLDYGCGPGKTAALVAERYGVDVTGVDISEQMLRIATEQHAHPRVRYRLLDSTRLAFVADDSLDAAMSCFVFINNADLAELGAIARAVQRVLRPGGRYVVMDSNPDATGVRFSSFQTGEPGRSYGVGEPRRVELYGDDGTLELVDYHWPAETYEHVLRTAGFKRVELTRPLLNDVVQKRFEPLPAEAKRSPLLVATAQK